jgi:hypothetical protein
MTPARLFVACIFLALLLLLRVLAASAGPADPRLLNGVLEWPSVVANEPFVIVRGDDGVLYDVGVTAARREGAVTAGARVSVLGIEGAPHTRSPRSALVVAPVRRRRRHKLQGTRPPAPAGPSARRDARSSTVVMLVWERVV